MIMVMPPKKLFIGVRLALRIAVYGFVKYPLDKGKFQIRYERIA